MQGLVLGGGCSLITGEVEARSKLGLHHGVLAVELTKSRRQAWFLCGAQRTIPSIVLRRQHIFNNNGINCSLSMHSTLYSWSMAPSNSFQSYAPLKNSGSTATTFEAGGTPHPPFSRFELRPLRPSNNAFDGDYLFEVGERLPPSCQVLPVLPFRARRY